MGGLLFHRKELPGRAAYRVNFQDTSEWKGGQRLGTGPQFWMRVGFGESGRDGWLWTGSGLALGWL